MTDEQIAALALKYGIGPQMSALGTIITGCEPDKFFPFCHAILQAASAAPAQEPIATVMVHNTAGECRVQSERLCPELPVGMHSLYAAPAAGAAPTSQMLTVEQMESLIVEQAARIFELENAAHAQEPVAWMTPDDWGHEPLVTSKKSVVSAWKSDGREVTPLYAAPVASAAPVVLEDPQATFEVIQDGMAVAGASGPRNDAMREAQHYAAVYGQDGPVEIREKCRRSTP